MLKAADAREYSQGSRSVQTAARPARPAWQRIGLAVVLILAVAAPLWHLKLIEQDFPASHNDLAAVWVGSRDTLHGADPYADAATKEIERMYYGRQLTAADSANKMGFAYPAYTALVLAPLAWLPFGAAKIAFLSAAVVLMAASVPLWLRVLEIRLTRGEIAVLTVLALASWPLVWALRLCQATLVVAAFVAIGCALLKRGRDGWAGAMLALTLIKPQLVLLTLAWLLLWATLKRRWSFVGVVLGVSSALFLGAEALLPGWIPGWAAAIKDYSRYTHMVPGMELLFSAWFAAPLLVALGIGGVLVLWRMRGCAAETPEFGWAIGLTLALSVSLLPTALPVIYNQIFLLPGVMVLLYAAPFTGYRELARKLGLFFVAVGYALVPIAIAGILLCGRTLVWETLPLMNLLLPVFVTVALIARMSRGLTVRLRPAMSRRTAVVSTEV